MQKKGRMLRKRLALCLVSTALFLTGCPHNQYVLDLTPHGRVIERKLVFYREDGEGTNGMPNYHGFPSNELKRISALYPVAGIRHEKDLHTAIGEFGSAMPKDIGGAGSYTNLETILGSAGFYSERFRGDDDVATRTAKRMKSADQFVDLIIGWSRAELGHERNYERLRKFLDGDFRNDVRNLSLYFWLMQDSASSKPDAPEEFGVRFGQYMIERGYLGVEDFPDVFVASESGDSQRVLRLIQRLVAAKLGIPKSAPVPASLGFLGDPDAAWQSWMDYLSTTDRYRMKLRHWQKEKLVSELDVLKRRLTRFYNSAPGTNAPPAAPAKPKPEEVAEELTVELIEWDWDTDDHMAVHLLLPVAPTHTNGKWDEMRKQIRWESNLDSDAKPKRMPAFCYANWSEPNEAAQMAHFGKVILNGDDLSQYCLWRKTLNKSQAAEWDTWLAGLEPGNGLREQVSSFHFSSGTTLGPTNSTAPFDAAVLGKNLIISGLSVKP